jgi:hypothetical protein
MDNFDLDNFKKTWQEQDKQSKYSNADILKMLNQKSRNYVKYILWISIAEFLLFGGISIFYMLYDDGSDNIIKLMGRLGIVENQTIKADMAHLNFFIKLLSLVITGVFVVIFYKNYKKINLEANIKQFILQILQFKNTVKLFISTNIILLVVFNILITGFIFNNVQKQEIHLQSHDWWVAILTILATTLFSLALIYIYYKIFYGIILKKLSKNLRQLQKMEKENAIE